MQTNKRCVEGDNYVETMQKQTLHYVNELNNSLPLYLIIISWTFHIVRKVNSTVILILKLHGQLSTQLFEWILEDNLSHMCVCMFVCVY